MADCESVDAALARLGNNLDGLVRKVDNIEKNCCPKGNSQNPTDLSAILKRLDDLEEAVKKIAVYVKTTDDAIKTANGILEFITGLFNF
jgi:hypothetical protein